MAESIKLSQEIIDKFFDNSMINESNDLIIHLSVLLENSSNIWWGRDLPYHNNEHCIEVMKRVWYLYHNYNDFYNIKKDEIGILLHAAIVHDVGYALGATPECHELVSARYTVSNPNANPILWNAILDTKIDKTDISYQSRILRDADILNWTFDFEEFFKYTIQVAEELKFKEEKIFHLFLSGTLNQYLAVYKFHNGFFNVQHNRNISHLSKLVKFTGDLMSEDEIHQYWFQQFGNLEIFEKYSILTTTNNFNKSK